MSDHSLSANLLSPTGQDAQLIAEVLNRGNIESVISHSVDELCQRTHEEVGILVIAQEALTPESVQLLNTELKKQPAWSDIPIILLTTAGRRNQEFKVKHLEVFVTSGNVTLLERPLQQLSLLSAVKVALRSRKRQFLVRDLLLAQLEATKMRDEFISIASHELKTPLTSLKLQSQMARQQIIKKRNFSLEKMSGQLDYTINQIDRLNKLVDDMLDISRITTGKLKLEKTEFDLSNLLEELIERFRPQFEEVGCEISKDITPNLKGNWDAYKIEQVLNNLFSNAIRYSPQTKIEIGLKQVNDKIVLNVRDYGVGIHPHNITRIFERFERASSDVSGLGLGLYITRQIIEHHRGTIRVESELGKGANFIIELPHN